MTKSAFIFTIIATWLVYIMFFPESKTSEHGSEMYQFGEAVGVGIGLAALGTVSGFIIWIVSRAIARKELDLKIFIAASMIVIAALFLLGAWGCILQPYRCAPYG
jgi:predicted RND superfamily exporter protein